MGIQGLLPTLKSIISPVHVQIYAGKRAAIDTYSWLHKAAYTCSKDLCEGRPTDKFIDYCMHRVNLLRHNGVQPVLVFDGGVLPMKADQEAKRAKTRKEQLERAQEHERLGNHLAAYECYQRAVDITPALASRLIKVLQKEGVEYIVAPYEADAQMAYLAFQGLVDVIITEDSDLIAYGCPRVLFKMTKSGQGDEFQFNDLVRNKDLSFANFTKQMVLEMCVMTGCDYLPSLPGMGVKKAHGLMRRFKSYQKVIRHLRFSGITISAQYEEYFGRALLTFHHQRVYDPNRQEMVHLTDVPDHVTVDLEFVGPDLPQKLVKAIAEGEVDPSTNLPFQEAITAVEPAMPKSGPKVLARQTSAKKPLELPARKNVLTNYFISESQEAKKQFKAPRVALCTEQQTKNLPAKDTLDFRVSETEDPIHTTGVYPDATQVFGTPLPDDDDDKDSKSDGVETRNNMVGSEPQVSCELATTTGRFYMKEREKHINDEPPVKRSGYFSHSQLVQTQSGNSHRTVVSASINVESFEDADSCSREVKKKSRIESHEAIFENAEAGSSPLGSQPQLLSDDVRHMRRKPSGHNMFGERNQLSPLSIVPGEGGSSEVGKFSSNVSHVDQFAHVAQKSIDRFVQTIAPFRCSSKGARASGLRAPLNNISSNTSTKIAGKEHSNLKATLNQFAHRSSSFKPPSLSLKNYS